MILGTVVALVVILSLSAFFSGSETALMSLNRYRLRHLERHNRKAALVREVVAHPERVLATILTGNVFVNTAAGALATFAVTLLVSSPDRQAQAISGATLVLTGLILVFGELVPKSLAARYPEKWSFAVIRPIRFLIRVLSPFVAMLTWITGIFLGAMGIKPRPLQHEISIEEIKSLVYAGGEPARETDSKRRMLRRVLELGDRRVAEVMVPRTEIVAVEIGASLEQIVAVVRQKRFSRLPVYRDTLDDIEGIVYSKDLLALWGTEAPFRIETLLRKPFFLPDGAKIEQALEQMQQHRAHMALVVDEHGGVEGLVTLEDLIEEIVGEIGDEPVHEAEPIRPLGGGQYLVSGAVSVKDLNERLGTAVPEDPGYNTLAGFILTRLGRIPTEGDAVVASDRVFEVTRVDGRRVVEVKVRPPRSGEEERPSG